MKQGNTAQQGTHTGSYLLHIYRQQDGNGKLLVGTLEKLGDDGKQPFSSVEELLKLLGAGNPDTPPRPRNRA